MREIKFRAWVENEDMMTSPDESCDGRYLLTMSGKNFRWDEAETGGKYYGFKERIKLMQYTGLKDKNGKEIAEFDVVTGVYTGVVIYAWGSFLIEEITYFNHPYGVDFRHQLHDIAENGDLRKVEVIGNIYENPELLEDNK